MSDVGESCFPSIDTISAETGLSRRAVIEHLRKAKDLGWVKVGLHGFRGQKWKSHEYTVAVPEGGYAESPASEKAVTFAQEDGDFHDKKVVTEGNSISTRDNSPENSSKEREHTPPTAPPLPRDDRPVPISNKPKRNTETGTRLPPDWFLSTELGEWALAEGLTREQIQREADKFRDYWASKPGAAGRKLNWAATWRNWIRRSLEIAPGGPPNGKYQHGAKSRIDGTAIDMHDTSWLDDDALEYIRQGAEIGERQRARLRSGKS